MDKEQKTPENNRQSTPNGKVSDKFVAKMSVHKQSYNQFELVNMSEDDLHSLLRMINSACLSERRDWNNIKEQIMKILDE